MRIRQILLAVVVAVCAAACGTPAERVIERPHTGVRNTRTIEIDKIVLTDTATVVYVDAYFHPHMWIRIDSVTYLRGGGQKYMITGSDGIALNAEHYMPDSGEHSFVLFFEPIDPKLKSIDFIEGEPAEYFKIFDIRLDGRKSNYASNAPRHLRNMDYKKQPLPEPVYNSAETVVKIHLAGEPEGYPMPPTYYLMGMLDTNAEAVEPQSAENGTYTYLIPLYGPTQMEFTSGGSSMRTVILEPGVENNIWVDLPGLSQLGSRYIDEKDTNPLTVVTDNRYAAVNAILGNNLLGEEWELNLMSLPEEEIKAMSQTPPSEVAAAVRKKYDELVQALDDNTSLAPIEKDLIRARIDGTYFFEQAQLPHRMAYEQKQALGLDYRDPFPAGVEQFAFSEDDFNVLFAGLDPASMPGPYARYPGYGFMGISDPKLAGLNVEGSFARHVNHTQEMMYYVETMDIPEPVQARFDSVPEQALKDAVAFKQAIMQRKAEEAATKTGYRICEVPDVADAKLFDAIVGQYAGKVVVVDFWATWCSPCRSSMKNHEPHKDEFLGKDVAFVYLTGSSPRKQWEIAIADVRGDHYFLTEQQWQAVCEKFDVQGIPSWVVVTKKGEYLKESLYQAAQWQEVINRELAK